MSNKFTLTAVVAILLLGLLSGYTSWIEDAEGITNPKGEAVPNEDDLNLTHILQHIRYFSDLGSRVTGYPGIENAAIYIKSVLEEYLGSSNVSAQRFSVLVPKDNEARILDISDNRSIKAYTVWPNSIQTSMIPVEGLTGNLIYVGAGELEDFNGKDVDESIVLMNFNSFDNWLNAAKLGAKAVIFVSSPFMENNYEAMAKFVATPVYFPRLYVDTEEAEHLVNLSERNALVTIFSRMRYEEVSSENVIGIIKGTKFPNDVIIISAYYDSWSVVPAKSPGAVEALGVSTLLEIARYLTNNPPLRTVWLVAFSGHWQSVAGAREFVEEYFFSNDIQSGGTKLLAQINLDLSTEADSLDLLFWDYNYRFLPLVSTGYLWMKSYLYQRILPQLGKEPTYLYDGLEELRQHGTSPTVYILDSGPAAASGVPAFTLRTSYATRITQGTTINDLHVLESNLDNVRSQLTLTLGIVTGLINAEPWGGAVTVPTRFKFFSGLRYAHGFITLKGNVLEYNTTRAWYSPVPRALVMVSLSYATITRRGIVLLSDNSRYPFVNIYQYADEEGSFVVHGLAPIFLTGTSAPYAIYAFVVNETDGQIVYSPDMGVYGVQRLSNAIEAKAHPTYANAIVFRSKSVTLFDVFNPQKFVRAAVVDPRYDMNHPFNYEPIHVDPYDIFTRSTPIFWGVINMPYETVAMVFVQPQTRFAIKLSATVRGRLETVGFLSNASDVYPEGYGYVTKGNQMIIPLTAYRLLEDVLITLQARYDQLQIRRVRKISAEQYLEQIQESFMSASRNLENKLYDSAYSSSFVGLAWSTAGYAGEVMPLYNDLLNTSTIFITILIAFVMLFESLVFRMHGRRRFVSLLIVSGSVMAAFYFAHPAFQIMANSYLAFIGIVSVMLLGLMILVFLSETRNIMEETSLKLLGRHRLSTTTISGALIFLPTVAIENMRRRKLRTVFSLLTLVTVSFALTSLTSTSNTTVVRSSAILGYQASYDGLLVKLQKAGPPQVLDSPLVSYLEGATGMEAMVLPRFWYYPTSFEPVGVAAYVYRNDKSVLIRAFSGMTAKESQQLFSPIIEGRPFVEEDYYAGIITDSTATTLEVKVGDIVTWSGMKLTVVGIYDPSIAQLNDLDNLPISPLDPTTNPMLEWPRTATTKAVSEAPLSWDDVVIVPEKLGRDLGGYLSSVSVKFGKKPSFDAMQKVARTIISTTNIPVYMGWDGTVYAFSRTTSWFVMGWQSLAVAVGISILNVMAVMIGSIRERSKDINTYCTLGLTPRGIAIMFLTESAIYGVVSSIVGYLIGFVLNQELLSLGILPESFILNFSSFAIILAIVAVIASSIASSAYPVFIASKSVTPSFERKWKVPTKPRGDNWSIPLPFFTTDDKEARGILEFLHEYLDGTGRMTRTSIVRDLNAPSEDLILNATVALPPYEQGIIQKMTLRSTGDKSGRLSFFMELQRVGGSPSIWRSCNYGFLDSIRKQILLWRSLTSEEKEKYTERSLTRA